MTRSTHEQRELLERLASSLDAEPTLEVQRSLLVAVGHALHAGVPLPAPLSAWLSERLLREVGEVIAGAEGLEPDDVAALATAARLVAIKRGAPVGEVPGLGELLDATRALRDAASEPVEGPGLEEMTQYIEHGMHAQRIERWASEHEDYAEDLESTIDLLRSERESVSLVARRWFRARRGEQTPLTIEVVGVLAASAAFEEADEPSYVWLGTLLPLASTARLVLSGGHVELRVDEVGETLARVTLAGARGERGAGGVWRVRIPVPSVPVELCVQAEDGRTFADRIALALAEG